MRSRQISGDSSAVAPPVPIPNTAVKRCSPDGSTAIGRARVGRRQSKTPLVYPAGFLAFLKRPTEEKIKRARKSRHQQSSRRGTADNGSTERAFVAASRAGHTTFVDQPANLLHEIEIFIGGPWPSNSKEIAKS